VAEFEAEKQLAVEERTIKRDTRLAGAFSTMYEGCVGVGVYQCAFPILPRNQNLLLASHSCTHTDMHTTVKYF
jgi:hypothetical protein